MVALLIPGVALATVGAVPAQYTVPYTALDTAEDHNVAPPDTEAAFTVIFRYPPTPGMIGNASAELPTFVVFALMSAPSSIW
jgi:hypothetical protein